MSIITICERREAKGLDAHVPLILRGDARYDPDLDRFFLDLPLSGIRSRHSLRAYAYDVAVWLRFLDACGKTVWAATRDDVDAYHRERRRDDAGHRITAASWNRAVVSLDRLYRWGEQQGLIAEEPFSRRAVWRPAQGGRRGMIAARNGAYERVARRSDVRFVTMDDYRIFREVGLRGLAPDGTERFGARDRNGLRNALFADLLVTTGLRLEEASGLRYTLATSAGRSTPRDAYSPFVARALRDAARADVEAMFRRFGAEDQTDEGDPVIARARADVEAVIARHGYILTDRVEVRRLYFMRLRRGLPLSTLIDDLHRRHHLHVTDLPSLLVLLSLDTGLEPECLKALTVDCLANPSAGTVELRYMKRRARGAEYKSLRVRDGGIGTPGGLIRRLIEVTAVARQHLPCDCLWVYHSAGGLHAGIRHPRERLDAWVARHRIVDDDGKPLYLLLARLRKTHKALWYTKTEGHMARFAVGHTREVAARHYADLPSLRPLHEATVADAFREAVAAAMPTILAPTAEQSLRDAPEQAAPLMTPDTVGPLLDGDQDLWLAACAGFYSSPFAEAGSPCSQPFWGCLHCPNAVITARKLPAIIAFLAFVEEQRRGLPGPDWMAKFGQVHARIVDQILPAFSDAVIAEARLRAADEHLYLPPETRA